MMLNSKKNIFTDIYDCLVVAGGMGEGHIPVVALDEMIRVVKPGIKLSLASGLMYVDMLSFHSQINVCMFL